VGGGVTSTGRGCRCEPWIAITVVEDKSSMLARNTGPIGGGTWLRGGFFE